MHKIGSTRVLKLNMLSIIVSPCLKTLYANRRQTYSCTVQFFDVPLFREFRGQYYFHIAYLGIGQYSLGCWNRCKKREDIFVSFNKTIIGRQLVFLFATLIWHQLVLLFLKKGHRLFSNWKKWNAPVPTFK